MSPKRFTQSAALGLAIAAFAAPSAANAQDLRSPDARTAAPAVHAGLDLRSPDARTPVQAPTGKAVDLRTPDSRDLGLGRSTADAPAVTVVKVREPAPAPVADGIDWGDAGIGAAALLGLCGLALRAAFAAAHRRGPATTT
jgi:hypothetical protein